MAKNTKPKILNDPENATEALIENVIGAWSESDKAFKGSFKALFDAGKPSDEQLTRLINGCLELAEIEIVAWLDNPMQRREKLTDPFDIKEFTNSTLHKLEDIIGHNYLYERRKPFPENEPWYTVENYEWPLKMARRMRKEGYSVSEIFEERFLKYDYNADDFQQMIRGIAIYEFSKRIDSHRTEETRPFDTKLKSNKAKNTLGLYRDKPKASIIQFFIQVILNNGRGDTLQARETDEPDGKYLIRMCKLYGIAYPKNIKYNGKSAVDQAKSNHSTKDDYFEAVKNAIVKRIPNQTLITDLIDLFPQLKPD